MVTKMVGSIENELLSTSVDISSTWAYFLGQMCNPEDSFTVSLTCSILSITISLESN